MIAKLFLPVGRELKEVTLTTEHAASSYGQPVLVIDGHAYGVGDRTPFGLAGGLAMRLVNRADAEGVKLFNKWRALAGCMPPKAKR